MAVRHITKAKTHVFDNDDLSQVLHAADPQLQQFSKTKGERLPVDSLHISRSF